MNSMNTMNNLNQATLSEANQRDVMQAIATIRDKLSFLINLSKEERRSLPKMGDKTRIFVQKALKPSCWPFQSLPT